MPVYAILLTYAEVVPVAYEINDASLVVYADCNSIDMTQPNDRKYILAGSTYPIEWFDCRDVPSNNYYLSYSIDNGQNWLAVMEDPVSDTSYDWQVPEVSAEHCLVKIEDVGSPLSDVSDTAFTIYECPSPPTWDLTGDCYINLADFQIIASAWLQPSGYTLNDLESFALNWLTCSNIFDPECDL
ncbi:MAG: hypothetical protein ACYSUS_09365 [Planctomycetota bacterium]|jgi:hypothetical protein